MKVAVTGGAGKVGAWVVRALAAAQHEVVVLDRVRALKQEAVRAIVGDVTDLGQVYSALAGCEAVVHLAGIPTHGIVSDEATFRINCSAAFNVHEAAWRLGIRLIVSLSSEAVLGWAPGAYRRLVLPHYLPVDEEHPCLAQDAYGLSKICGESIARSFALKSDMTCVMLRPPWVVSPEELATLHRNNGARPDRFRLYHYVDARDLAEVCRRCIERPPTGFNALFVGSGETTLAEPLCEVLPRLAPALANMARPLRGPLAAVSIQKVRQLLDWTPRYSWRDPSAIG
jgi:nucleoside-diphosphate-sugar epimerase